MKIRLLVLDVDGVLTDGTFWLREDGDEWKAFHATDGLGLRLLMDAGVEVALLSGRRSAIVERRARELGIRHVVQGSGDKVAAIYRLLTELGVEAVETAYMGDDLVDVPAMRLVGFAAAPADARPEALAAAAWVAARGGGRGAVRDLCEHLLREMGRWDEAAARFLA